MIGHKVAFLIKLNTPSAHTCMHDCMKGSCESTVPGLQLAPSCRNRRHTRCEGQSPSKPHPIIFVQALTHDHNERSDCTAEKHHNRLYKERSLKSLNDP